MNTLTTTNTTTQVTMSSLELVEFINSKRQEGEAILRHDHFIAKVPKVLGEEGVLNFRDTYIHPQNGQSYPCYIFPKREACLMAMSYSYELQASVYDRMTALEQNTPKIPLTYLEALQCHLNDQLLLEQKNKEIQDMSTKIQEDKPLVEFAQTIALSSTNLKMSEYAKVISKELGYGRNTLYKVLRDKKIYTTKNLPLQSYINKGYFVVVENVHNNIISLVVTITPLGQQKLLAYLKKQ